MTPHREPLLRFFLFAIALLLLPVCARETGPAATPSLKLADCRLKAGKTRAKCGTFEVFEDRASGRGRRIALSVAVLPATSSVPRPDPLVLLAGGPGQAASDIAGVVAAALERVRRDRDFVVIDQRGTGDSNPLHCDFDRPEATLAERLGADLEDARIDECRASLEEKADLRFYGTELAVADLEEVRAALGYERINLWGGSYGTRVGLAYLRRHPERVRTAVLDGVAPMALVLPVDVAKDAERAMQLLLRSCEENEACAAAFPEVGRRFASLLETLAREPVTTSVADPLTGRVEEVTIGRELFVRLLRVLLYQTESTSLVPFTIARAAAGDFRPLVAQAELVRTSTRKLAAAGMHYSVLCTEDLPFIDHDSIAAATLDTFLGRGPVDELLRVCERWPKGEVPADFREPVRSDVPVLLLSGELDPVTPPRWADEAAKTLTRSLHVTVPGVAHGTLGDACTRRLIADFVSTGSVEGLPTTCSRSGTRPPFFTSFAGPSP